MISALHLIWIIPLAASIGLFAGVFLAAKSRLDDDDDFYY